MDQRVRSPARFLAPIALLAAVVVVVIVVVSSLGGGGAGDGGAAATRTPAPDGGAKEEKEGEGPSTYEVQSGDTLGAIAEETNVSVEELLELNPDVDPEALSTGQELKLRE
jgi:LysM repeat protein